MANLRGQDGSFLVLFKDDSKKEVFMILRTDYPLWVLTGGGIEPDESPQQTAIREASEETGFKSQVVRQVGKYEYPYKCTYLFEGRYVSGIYQPEFKGNIGKWFSVDHLPLDITSSTRRKIHDVLHHQDEQFIKTISNELPLIDNLVLILRHPRAFVTFINKSLRHRK